MRTFAALVLGAAACAASAQTMTYFWTVTTNDGDTDVGVGEWAHLELWARMEPQEVGYASTYFDIRGVSNWDQGTVLYYDNIFEIYPWDEGDLQANNDILSIESAQLPPVFNPNFDAGNPVRLYILEWVPDDYSASMVVEVGDANHLHNEVYTDRFGTSIEYDGLPGVARFTVNVPGPGAVAVLGVAALGWRARR